MIIYRGYTIKPSGSEWIITKGGNTVHAAASENAAYLWIDGEKAVEHKTK